MPWFCGLRKFCGEMLQEILPIKIIFLLDRISSMNSHFYAEEFINGVNEKRGPLYSLCTFLSFHSHQNLTARNDPDQKFVHSISPSVFSFCIANIHCFE